jgi:hypothetical protein
LWGERIATSLRYGLSIPRAGGLICSANDLLGYARFQLGDGRLTDGERLHDDYLMKPIDLRQLLKTIHVLLNIEWVYDTQAMPVPAPSPVVSEPRLPSRDDIGELIGLGEIGHIRRIQEKLNELEHTAPEYSSFVAQMRVFVNAFDLKRYLAALEAARSNHA